jgi:hypothetical protein
VQLHNSASECKGVGNIPGSNFGKPVQLFRRIVNDVGSITKAPPFIFGSSRGNRYTSAAARPGKYGECSSVATLFFAKKSLIKTDRCAGVLS